MPLLRIQAGALADSLRSPGQRSALNAEAIRLAAGRSLLNRIASGPSVLIVVDGQLQIGVTDDDAQLEPGDGVFLQAGDAYSVVAVDDSLAFVFSTPTPPAPTHN